MRKVAAIVIALFALVFGSLQYHAAHASAPPALHVSGSTLVDSNNVPVRLHGVNFSGAEYSCTNSGTVWDTTGAVPSAAMLNSLLAAHVNAVRIPLNEDCWLGINGANPGGAPYQSAVESWVSQLEGAGITPIVDLHWTAPGAALATSQAPMMDVDHSAAFWQSVAGVYKSDQAVVFDVFNEPYVNTFACWKNGRSACTSSDASFPVLGMQEAVNDIRAVGASNVLLLGCLGYSNVCNQSGTWQTSVPTDSAHNLVASVHIYEGMACSTSSCWTSEYAPILAAGYPVLDGEFGDYSYNNKNVSQTFATSIMDWFDSNHASGYTAWTFDDWGGVEALTCAVDGSCLTTWGHYLVGQYTTRFPVGTPTPTPTNTPTPTPTSGITPTPTTGGGAPLTLYGSSVADGTLTTACKMSTAPGGVENSVKTTWQSGSGNYGELSCRGNTNAAAFTSIPAPVGKGWIYYPGAGTFSAGNWSAAFTVNPINNAGSWTLRMFKFSGSSYTLMGSITKAISNNSVKYVESFPATPEPSAMLGASDGVYFELTYQDTTGVPYDSVTLYESSSSIAGIMSEVQITTPPFIAG